MKTGDITLCDRAHEILRDVGQYVDELAHDELHDKWEFWTARMDTVNEELHELLDFILEMEIHSKQRMLSKSLKKIVRIRH